MQHSAPKRSRRWALICAIIAAVYAVPVTFAVWSNFPTQHQIDADTAASLMAALQQSDSKYSNLTPQVLRRRLYRGLSDTEVIARIRDQAATEEQRMAAQSGRVALDTGQVVVGDNSVLGGASTEPMRSQLAIAIDEIDKVRAQRMEGLKGAQAKSIASGVLAWVVPVIALYFFGPRWRALRPRRVRRL